MARQRLIGQTSTQPPSCLRSPLTSALTAAHQAPGGDAWAGSGGTAAAYKFFVPGLLIQLGLFGSTFVGFAIISD